LEFGFWCYVVLMGIWRADFISPAGRLYTVGTHVIQNPKHKYIWGKGSVDPVTRGKSAHGNEEQTDAMAIEAYASRPATEALRDYISRYRSLEWIPGYREEAAGQEDRGYSDKRRKVCFTFYLFALVGGLESFLT